LKEEMKRECLEKGIGYYPSEAAAMKANPLSTIVGRTVDGINYGETPDIDYDKVCENAAYRLFGLNNP
jgi:hypothetical protein